MTTDFFLDTSALIELVNGTAKGASILSLVKNAGRTLVSPLNLYEFSYQASKTKGRRSVESAIIGIKNQSEIFPVSEDVCLLAAKLRQNCENKGMGAVDFITAASAIASNSTLLTCDNDFREIKELKAEFV